MMNEVQWEEKTASPAIPLFDVVKGSVLIVATPRGVKMVASKYSVHLVITYPMTLQMLKSVGDAAAEAKKRRYRFLKLVTDKENDMIGFVAFK